MKNGRIGWLGCRMNKNTHTHTHTHTYENFVMKHEVHSLYSNVKLVLKSKTENFALFLFNSEPIYTVIM